MVEEIQGGLYGEDKKFAIIVSRFNDFITSRLQSGALDALVRHGVDEGNITIIKVPGSFEIPFIARKAAESGKYNAIICLGAVIKGDTPHFEYVASEVSKGIASVSLDSGVPVIFGVLTVNTIEQGIERAGTKSGNKGWDAAVSALELVNLMDKI